jgi:hypothetical protein
MKYKMKTQLPPEEIFLESIKTLIKNLLINNPNYKNNYYFQNSHSDTYNTLKLIDETKERSQYILEKISDWEHLIKEEINNNENEILKEKISEMRDVLRFCARNDVGTYYQQQSAKEMLLNNKKMVWSDHNSDGTYTEEYKQGIKYRFDEIKAKEILDRIDNVEKELLQIK